MSKKKMSEALMQDKNVKASASAAVLGVTPGAIKLSKLSSTVKATVGRSDVMDQIELCLFNDGQRNAVVEITGTVLHPNDSSFQRLFVAGRHDLATPIVKIPIGKEVRIPLATCCMDGSLHVPSKEIEYRITSEVPPENNVIAARNWIHARQAIANKERMRALDTQQFAIQKHYAGVKEMPAKNTAETERHAELGYVQSVCGGNKP